MRVVSCCRFTLVLEVYALQLGMLLLIRLPVIIRVGLPNGRRGLIATLFLLPVCAAVHAAFCGLLCKFGAGVFWPSGRFFVCFFSLVLVSLY